MQPPAGRSGGCEVYPTCVAPTVLSTTSAIVDTPGLHPAMLLTSSRQQDGLVVVGCTQPVWHLLC